MYRYCCIRAVAKMFHLWIQQRTFEDKKHISSAKWRKLPFSTFQVIERKDLLRFASFLEQSSRTISYSWLMMANPRKLWRAKDDVGRGKLFDNRNNPQGAITHDKSMPQTKTKNKTKPSASKHTTPKEGFKNAKIVSKF